MHSNAAPLLSDDNSTKCRQRTSAAMLQGIKFYEPEVVGATPEAVEYRGMHNLVEAVKEHVGYRHGKLIFSADGQVGQVSCLHVWRGCDINSQGVCCTDEGFTPMQGEARGVWWVRG